MSTASIRIGRVFQVEDEKTEAALQEIAQELGDNLQHGTSAPDANTLGKVYFERGTPDSNGWATVSTVYINTKR